MKKIIFALFIALAVFACKNAETEKENEDLKNENKSMHGEIAMKDTSIMGYILAFNEIQESLDSIKQKEKIITLNKNKNGELHQDIKDEIKEDILLIYKKLQHNKAVLAGMTKRMTKATKKIAELEKFITRLNEQLNQKDAEIENLKGELEKLNIQIGDLKASMDSVKVVKDSVVTQINTAYYVIGTDKELREQKVISKAGGFIGIGKMEKLIPDFNKSYFKKIDITKTTKIQIMSKKAEILTTHPSTSYSLDGKDTDKMVESITIKNPKEFWSASKYLVILVK